MNINEELRRRREILERLKRGPENYDPELMTEADLQRMQLEGTAYDDISTDPRLMAAQNDTLERLDKVSKDGYTAEEEAALSRARREANADDGSRRAAILMDMRRRGGGGGGAELAAQLASADAAAERQSQESMEAMAQGQRRSLQALRERGSLARDMQNQEFAQKERAAQARDRIREFNARVTGDQLRGRNELINQARRENVNNRNDWGWKTSELDYNDATAEANRKMAESQARRERRDKRRSALGGAIGGIAGGFLGAGGGPMGIAAGANAGQSIGSALFSDERKKKNIKDLTDDDVDEFLAAIRGKRFDYKGGMEKSGGDPSRVGVMAQDLEGTRVGQKIVEDSPDGKMLDVDNLLGSILVSVGRLEKKKKDKKS